MTEAVVSARRIVAALAASMLALSLVAFPLAQASRAAGETDFTVDNQYDFNSALKTCEALETPSTCTITITEGFEISYETGEPIYGGASDVNIVGVGETAPLFTPLEEGVRFLSAEATGTVVIQNIHLRGFTMDDSGGALAKWGGNLVLDRVTIEQSSAQRGGAVYFDSYGTLTVSNSDFESNSAELGLGQGGAIHSDKGSVSITSSHFGDNSASSSGGAVYVTWPGLVTVTDSTFVANSAGSGGAIYTAGSNAVSATDSTFDSNVADEDGGAIYAIGGNVNISFSYVGYNSASRDGGAVYAADLGGVTVTDSTLNANSAESGGAIFASGGHVGIDRSVAWENVASGNGGAVFVAEPGAVTVSDSTISANTADNGAAIYTAGSSSLSATNSTFDRNAALTGGGAVYANQGAVTFTHVTAVNNAPTQVHLSHADAQLTTTASAFIDTEKVGDQCYLAVDSTAVSLGYNWAQSADCWSASVTGDVTDGGSITVQDLDDNGGPTPTIRPSYPSPLIDKIPAGNCVEAADQRGVARPQGGACDIGAFEVVVPFPDVPGTHPFAEEIFWLSSRGVTGGYDDGTFRPSATVSRQAMAAFLYRFSGESFTAPAAPSFSDVPTSHPFFLEIEWLASTGVTEGYDDGTFRPGAGISRQAMAAFLYRFADEPGFTSPVTATFPDVPTSHRFYHEIEWLAATTVTGGYDDGTFRPTTSISRQAMAAFLYRFSNLAPV